MSKLKEKIPYWILAVVIAGGFIYFKDTLLPSLLEDDTDKTELGLSGTSINVVQEPDSTLASTLKNKYGISIVDQVLEPNGAFTHYKAKVQNNGRNATLTLTAVVFYTDGTQSFETLNMEGDLFVHGQTTWFEVYLDHEIKYVRSAQIVSANYFPESGGFSIDDPGTYGDDSDNSDDSNGSDDF